MPARRILFEKVAMTVGRHGMLSDGDGVVVAVSGGPDSLALLHILCELRDKHYPKLGLHAGHLHHGMRGAAADDDAEFVRAQCEQLGLPCSVEHADVPRLAREQRVGEEVAGREARYEFLTRLARSLGAGRIATGHHADDQAETILMRVMRGAGPRGMGGIPYTREIEGANDIRVVRPLLDCRRDEIETFLCDRGLQPRLDVTNLSTKYLRNRVRARMLPALDEAMGADLRRGLCAMAAEAQRLQARAWAIASDLEQVHRVRVIDRFVETEMEWLRAIPQSFRPELIRRWMRAAGMFRRALDRSHYERIGEVIDAGDGTVTLPGKVIACCSEGSFILCLAQDGDLGKGFDVQLAVPGVTPVAPLGVRLEATILDAVGETLLASARRDNRYEEILDFERLELPLMARFPRPGDRIQPLGAPGRRKLQDILTDERVPRWRRSRVLVVTMQDEPIWVVGVRLSHGVRVTERTRRGLRLRLITEGG